MAEGQWFRVLLLMLKGGHDFSILQSIIAKVSRSDDHTR